MPTTAKERKVLRVVGKRDRPRAAPVRTAGERENRRDVSVFCGSRRGSAAQRTNGDRNVHPKSKRPLPSPEGAFDLRAAWGSRTPDLRITSASLWPTELRRQMPAPVLPAQRGQVYTVCGGAPYGVNGRARGLRTGPGGAEPRRREGPRAPEESPRREGSRAGTVSSGLQVGVYLHVLSSFGASPLSRYRSTVSLMHAPPRRYAVWPSPSYVSSRAESSCPARAWAQA